MSLLKELKESIVHLFFPHVCPGCGSDLNSHESLLCLRCIGNMPETRFECFPDNPMEKIFWGRLPLVSASAGYYFSKESLVQNLMHQFKYKARLELGVQLGCLLGEQIARSFRFAVDAIVPLPLFPAKERKRGFNQSMVLCEGMARTLNLPVLRNVISRPQFTTSQTKKSRLERWQNMEGRFRLDDPGAIEGKHILLVDDVVTTGATLEACGNELLKANDTRLSIVTLCIATK